MAQQKGRFTSKLLFFGVSFFVYSLFLSPVPLANGITQAPCGPPPYNDCITPPGSSAGLKEILNNADGTNKLNDASGLTSDKGDVKIRNFGISASGETSITDTTSSNAELQLKPADGAKTLWGLYGDRASEEFRIRSAAQDRFSITKSGAVGVWGTLGVGTTDTKGAPFAVSGTQGQLYVNFDSNGNAQISTEPPVVGTGAVNQTAGAEGSSYGSEAEVNHVTNNWGGIVPADTEQLGVLPPQETYQPQTIIRRDAEVAPQEYRLQPTPVAPSVQQAPPSFYQPPVQQTLSYTGCFADDRGERALGTNLGWFGFTPQSCIELAKSRNFAYAGLQWKGECWAGNELRYEKVAETECNTPCDAQQDSMCGGGHRNSIYATGVANPTGTQAATLPQGVTYISQARQLVKSVGLFDIYSDVVSLIFEANGKMPRCSCDTDILGENCGTQTTESAASAPTCYDYSGSQNWMLFRMDYYATPYTRSGQQAVIPKVQKGSARASIGNFFSGIWNAVATPLISSSNAQYGWWNGPLTAPDREPVVPGVTEMTPVLAENRTPPGSGATSNAKSLIFQPYGGNVGIGKTPESQYKLDIDGTVRASATLGGHIVKANYQICFGDNDCKTAWDQAGKWSYVSGTKDIQYTGGNVGIGKDPDSKYKLDVNGDVKATKLCFGPNPEDCNNSWNNVGLWKLADNKKDVFYTGGHIGIGTNTPKAVLSTKGGNVAAAELFGTAFEFKEVNETGVTTACRQGIREGSQAAVTELPGFTCKSSTLKEGAKPYYLKKSLFAYLLPTCAWAPDNSVKENPPSEAKESIGYQCKDQYAISYGSFSMAGYETYEVSAKAEDAEEKILKVMSVDSGLTVSARGNVGIGTIMPVDKLQIGKELVLHDGAWKGMRRNASYTAGDRRIVEGFAADILINEKGDTVFRNAPSGGAESPISWINGWEHGSMMIKNTGLVSVGNTFELWNTNKTAWRFSSTGAGDGGKLNINPVDMNAGETIWSDRGITLMHIPGDTRVRVGINKTNPQYELDVTGDINVSSGRQISAAWGSGKTLAYAPERVGLDVAEIFESEQEVEAGDVMVVGSAERTLQKSSRPYQGQIIGVVSGSPAIVFEGEELKISPKKDRFTRGTKPPIALAGRVPVKVSLENGPIHVGDHLTTSSESGIAMRATDGGSVVGIALEAYAGWGEGQVLTFINIGEKQDDTLMDKLLERIEELEKKIESVVRD